MEIKEWLENYALNPPGNTEQVADDLYFVAECMSCYGIVLTGTKRHCCPDWDLLPIDETCEEIKACTCNWTE